MKEKRYLLEFGSYHARYTHDYIDGERRVIETFCEKRKYFDTKKELRSHLKIVFFNCKKRKGLIWTRASDTFSFDEAYCNHYINGGYEYYQVLDTRINRHYNPRPSQILSRIK